LTIDAYFLIIPQNPETKDLKLNY